MKRFLEMQKITGGRDNSNDFGKRVDDARAKILSRDKTLLEQTDVRLDFGQFNGAPDGRFIIVNHNVDFECLFKRNKESDTLYVFFSGSRQPRNPEPTFKRWTYYNYLDGSVLCIDDPMCRLYPDLSLGWYYGTKDENYCDYIAEIVKEFAARNGIKNIRFFSSSGGGFAALYCACRLPGSIACAINPQIKPSLYSYASRYERLTGLSLSTEDTFGRNNLPEMLKDSKDSKILLIENSASPGDMMQLSELCRVLNSEFNYGLSRLAPNILCWTYEAVSMLPHNAQDFVGIVPSIEFLINHFDDAEDYKDIYYMFGELWYSFYQTRGDAGSNRLIELIKSVDGKEFENKRQTETVSYKDVVIKANNGKYNRMVITRKLEPNSIYRLQIGNVSVLTGETKKVSVCVKDMLSDKVDFIVTHSVVGSFSVYFKTSTDTSKKEVRIYAGECGRTNNISLSIDSVKLLKIEE